MKKSESEYSNITLDNKKIGKAIYEQRKKHELSQEKLGEILGVERTAISKWENGYNLPDINALVNISKYFNVSLEQIMGVSDSKEDAILPIIASYNTAFITKKETKKLKKIVLVMVVLFCLLLAISASFSIKHKEDPNLQTIDIAENHTAISFSKNEEGIDSSYFSKIKNNTSIDIYIINRDSKIYSKIENKRVLMLRNDNKEYVDNNPYEILIEVLDDDYSSLMIAKYSSATLIVPVPSSEKLNVNDATLVGIDALIADITDLK